eukprot:TRINITY_DN118_c0_g1_i1.p1 TRINITY_DN118_c0_g1~~TRINITY_DN118_c0_g1_i1.p1  ORF type:complete len:1977 (+),score=693.89 TRINITY_DN118_c0_g1_i1:34526-40456(+)
MRRLMILSEVSSADSAVAWAVITLTQLTVPALYWLVTSVTAWRAASKASFCTAASCSRMRNAARLSSTSWKAVSTVCLQVATVPSQLAMAWSVAALRAPPSKMVWASCGPSDHTRPGSVNQSAKLELWQPPEADSVRLGKQAALATPILALAAATRRSAAATSGRRSSSIEGRPCGTGGATAVNGAFGKEKVEGVLPTSRAMACSTWARVTPLSSAEAWADFSWVCAWITSDLATMPAAYWFWVSWQERWQASTVSCSTCCWASSTRNCRQFCASWAWADRRAAARSPALAWALAWLASTSRRTLPQISASQEAVSAKLQLLRTLPVLELVDDEEEDELLLELPPLRDAEAEAASVGEQAERELCTSATALRKLASARARFWFEISTCATSAFNCASPNISHHLPSTTRSRGWAGCQSWPSLKTAGAGSSCGRTQSGPTEQAVSAKPASTTASRGFNLNRSCCVMRFSVAAASGRRCCCLVLATETTAPPGAQSFHVQVDHWRGVEREQLAHHQSADDGNAQRLAQLGAVAMADGQRDRAQQRRHGGHHDGTEAQLAGLEDGIARRQAVVALGIDGEVHHHDGVLLDDADQQDDADDADDAQVGPRDHQREQRAHAGRRQRREDGDGVDVALIEHAQHDVHGDDGRQDQPQGIGQRRLEGQRRPLEVGDGGGRHADLVLGGLDGLDRLAQGRALGQVEGHGGCRELADMVHHQRRGAFGDGGNRGQRHLAAGRGHQVDAVQRRGAVLEFRLDLHHHAILVRLRIDGGDEALAEGVVERIVDGGRGDAQARGSIAVDLDVGLQTLVLQVGGHIGQFRLLLQAGDQLGHPGAEHVGIGIFQGELVLRARDAILDGQVLHRLHVQGHARHLLRQRGLQAADDIGGRDVALLVRLQVDEHAAAVEGGIGAIHADEGRQALDGRIGQHHLGQLLLLLAHGAEGDRLRGFRDALDHAGILQREEALGYEHIQQHRQAQRGHGHQQGRLLVFQHPLQHAAIAGDDVVEEHLALVIEPALLFFGLVAQQARAHHGRQGERDHGRDQDRHRQRHREFVEQAPHHIAHEEQRDQHGDQGEGQRDDGEADLLGPLQGGLHGLHALFDVARDVLDHDDGIVHHEAGGNRQGHQRQVVDREAGQVHDREGPHQRQRHRYAGDDGGRHVAQEHEDHHHHQGNGQHQGELDVFDRGADGLGTVDQGIDVDGGRNGGTQARHGGLDAAHGLDYVGTGLLGDGQHDGAAIGDAVVAAGGRTGEGPGGDLVVLGAVHGHADVLDADRRAIAPGQDHVIPLIGLEQLVVGIDREALVGAIDRTLGLVHGGGGDDTANVFQADAQRGDLGRIDLDAHGRFLLAVDVDQAHPRDLRDLLGQDVVGIVVDHRQRQFIGLHRHDHDGRIGRVDLAEGRGIGQVGRQLPGRRIDGGLHVQCSGIDVAVQVELQGDLGAAQGTLRGHLREAGNERELALQRLGHIGGHGLGTAAGQLRGDLDGREVHLRQRCHRQQRPDRHPHQQDGDGQQRGTDGAFDEGCGNAHLVLPFACALAALAVAGLAAAGLLSTMRAPGLSLYWPSSTTRSSGLRAASATSTAIPSWMRSTLTGCTKAWSWASTAQTQVPCWLRWMAAAGRVGTSPWVFICRRALTYWPGHSLWSALSKRAFSCTVPLLVLIWLSSKTSLPVARVSCESRAQATTLSGCWLSRWAWLMVPTASSGRVKSRVIGSIWLMTTRPLASAAWTILPGSTRRTPTRPEMGAVMVVQLSCTLAQAIWASSVLTAASSWATRAFCVSSCCWVAASWLRRVVQRCRSRRALSNCAASLARWASAWASWACRARGSIWASNWPFLTSSPSLKPTLSSCPSMRVLTVTLALAVTVPTPARQSGKSRCCTVVRLTDTGGAALAGAWSAALARCMCSQPPAPAARIRAVATATAVEERLGAWEDVVMPETRPEMIAGQIGIRRNGGWKPVSVRPSESLLRWPPGRPGSPASRRRQP